MLTVMKFDLVPKNKLPIRGVRLPDDDKFDPPVTVCPYECKDVVIPYEGAETTLVGWLGGVDPNHWTQHCKCPKCERTFVHEWKFRDQNEWYCDQRHGKVLMGVPSCCQSVYKYPCECGGTMTLTHKGIVSISFKDGVQTRTPERDIVKCDKCDNTIDVTGF